MAKKQSEGTAKSSGNGKGDGLKVGLGLAAVAAAAAGAYFFYGPNGSKNRKQLKSWAVKAKGEVMEKMELLGEVSEKTYNATVDQVLSKYKKLKSVNPGELLEVTNELKNSWKSIKEQMDKATSIVKKGKGKSTR